MSTLAPPKPAVHRWTSDAFLRLAEQGHFAGQRVELIDGKIIDMPAQKNAHLIGVEKTAAVLKRAFGRKFWVRAQATLNLAPFSAPDPDVAVVNSPRRADEDYPTSAVLVVEVSDSTLWFDRNRKSVTYAAAALPEYWIVNLVDRQLEVHRDPVPNGGPRRRARYASVTVLKPGQRISPLGAPRASVLVTDLLP